MGQNGVIIMFIGEYDFNIDDNHRINIPNNFKKNLEDKLVIAKGFEKCLYLFNQSDWEILSDKINALSITKANNRKFIRALNSGAYEVAIDSKGRILLGQKLIDHAALKKECVIVGASNHIEIWDKEEWKKELDSDPLSEISEDIDI